MGGTLKRKRAAEERREMEAQMEGGDGLIMKLPHNIIVGIFTKLPIWSLLRCRCVCKTWRDIVSDPLFAHTQLTASASAPTNFTNVMVTMGPFGAFCLFELNPNPNPNPRMRFNTPFKLPGNEANLKVVGCCNGILCLFDQCSCHGTQTLYVTNPILGEYLAFPQSTHFYFYMFGFSAATGQYKVLRFLPLHIYELESYSTVEVLTIGIGGDDDGNGWRNIGYALGPKYVNYNGGISSVTLNGALHWLTPPNPTNMLIGCFDIDTQQLHPFPHPPQLGRDCAQLMKMRLAVLGNCLCLFDALENGLDVWAMKDYGVAESWTKVYKLFTTAIPCGRGRAPQRFGCCRLYPFTVWKDGQVLMSTSDYSTPLFSCDPKVYRFKKLNIYGLNRGFVLPIPFTPSLLSLKDIVSPHSSMVVNVI